jgi:outer membrane protein assembly factor BamD (BamD/ComL family)
MEAEKNLRIAKFYLRESQPRSTEVYLRLVLDRNPNSSAAREAREIRRELDRTRDRW